MASGGPDRVFFQLIQGLDRSSYKPLLVVSKGGGRYFDFICDDVEKHILGGGRYPVRRFARVVDELRPDIVITTLRMNITAALARPFQNHRPALITRQANAIEANFTELKKTSLVKHQVAELLTKAMLRSPDVMIAQSTDMAEELKKYTSKNQKVTIIGNPIDVEETNSNARAHQSWESYSKHRGPTFISAGRLAPQKGYDLLIPAFGRIRQCEPGATLTIVGEGPQREYLEKMIVSLDLSDAVNLAGQKENVLELMASSDIFVSASRYEGFSNAILEAMALGKPVVATNCEGGTKDMILDGETGILAQSPNEHELYEALKRVLKADLSELGIAAKKHVEMKFSKSKIIAKYEAVFREVLKKR